jgi:guanylate kinase
MSEEEEEEKEEETKDYLTEAYADFKERLTFEYLIMNDGRDFT